MAGPTITFRYKAYTAEGRLEAGTIAASSKADALDELKGRGLVVFESEALDAASASSPAHAGGSLIAWRRAMSLDDYARLVRELAVLLEAELPLDAALRLVARRSASSRAGTLVSRLHESVAGGSALSDAFERHATEAPPVIVSLIRAGEAQGSLSRALVDLADFLEARAALKAELRAALTYPAVLVAVAVLAITLIVMVLVPALMPIYADGGASAPLVLRLAKAVADIANAHGTEVLIGLLLLLLGLNRLWKTTRWRQALERVVERLPWIGTTQRLASTAILARTLGALLANGVPVTNAMIVAAAAVPSRPFREAMVAATERVREGQRIAAALAATGQLDDQALRFIAIGEESSRLDRMLLHLGRLAEADLKRRLAQAVTLLSPALTIAIGGGIGLLFVSVVQALLSVNQAALQ